MKFILGLFAFVTAFAFIGGFIAGNVSESEKESYAHHKYVYGFAAGFCAHLAGEDGSNLEAVEGCVRDYLYRTGQGDTWEEFH